MLASDDVEVAVTKLGGHMSPVTCDRNASTPISPYYVSPWQDENLREVPDAVFVPSVEPNMLSTHDVRTAATPDAAHPTEIHYVRGAMRVPAAPTA